MLNSADDAVIEQLHRVLPENAFRASADGYFLEPRRRWQGQGVVVAPASTVEVAAVVKVCQTSRVGLVPYGGGTGLVGGQIVPDGPVPVILSLERMNAIRDVYPTENAMVVEAGCILSDVQAAAEEHDRLFALSLASEGSARIGGLLATNAGGVNVLRYGNARTQCLGLEVVRPDGTIWNGLTRLRKDNTGYDLRNLMIGSEGTLGIITAATLRLVPRPAVVGTAMMAVTSPAIAIELLALAQQQIGEGVSAFEIIHRQGLDFLSEVGPDIRKPFAEPPEWTVLIDLGLPETGDADAALERLFVSAMDKGWVSDGVIARSTADRQAFWTIRENIPEANRRIGSISSHDIALPLSAIPDFIEQAGRALAELGDIRINCFGHLGDGNLHYNVFPPKGGSRDEFQSIRDKVKKTVHDITDSFGGSVSAEHGIGRLKVEDLETYADPAKLDMMRAIKAALDPQGIMNPGAVLRG